MTRHAANFLSVGRAVSALAMMQIGLADIRLAPSVSISVLALIFLSDAFDGAIARHFKRTSLLGSFLDIFADRAVEFFFFLFFLIAGAMPVWFLIVFYGRIGLTDWCRLKACLDGKVLPSGIMLPPKAGMLTLSPFSRAGYAVVKMMLITYIYAILASGSSPPNDVMLSSLLTITLAWSAVRALPIIYTYGLRTRPLFSGAIPSLKEFSREGSRLLPRLQIAFDVVVVLLLISASFGFHW